MLFRVTTIVLACVTITGCALAEPPKVTSPVCDPKPCVTLNGNQLKVLSPIVGDRFQQVQQEYQAIGAVVQDIQKQIQLGTPVAPSPILPKK